MCQHTIHKVTHFSLKQCEKLPTPRYQTMSLCTNFGMCTIEYPGMCGIIIEDRTIAG